MITVFNILIVFALIFVILSMVTSKFPFLNVAVLLIAVALLANASR